MFDFYQKRKLKTLLGSPILQVGVLLVTVMVAWSAFERYRIASEMQERRQHFEQQAAALEARKATLEEQVDYLSNERGIEAEMRRQFDVTRAGEQVVVIVDPEEEVEIQPLSTSTNEKAPWYQFWR